MPFVSLKFFKTVVYKLHVQKGRKISACSAFANEKFDNNPLCNGRMNLAYHDNN